MKYRVTVYFDGPRSSWAKKLDANEIIFQCDSPWLWHARQLARSNVGNQGRCSYVIHEGETIVEEFRATVPFEPARI